MSKIKTQLYLDGKPIKSKKDLPKGAKLKRQERVHKDHYETSEYTQQQAINASNYFSKMRQDRDDLEQRHG
jgi:hypothetical protein